jgi:hypothetical protein
LRSVIRADTGIVGPNFGELCDMSILEKLFSGRSITKTTKPEFHPSNELEHALVQAQAREMSVDDFFARLLASQVAILLDRKVPQSGWHNGISPLVLVSPRAGNNVLAVFTSVERATPMSQNSKTHKYALLVDFRWVLKGTTPGLGVVVNPGWPVGVEIEPARVVELKNA